MILFKMRSTGPSHTESRRVVSCAVAVLLAVAVSCALPAWAGQPASSKAPASQRKSVARQHKPSAPGNARPAAPPPIAVPTPEPPKPPAWPANDRATPATVVWNSQGLRIDAANASLQDILRDVATATGAKISGSTADQRVFGTYGPGPARDVLSQLLDGSGYNVLMIGDQGQGTPRQIQLSRRPTGPAPMVANNNGSGDDDNSANVEEPPPPLPVQPQPPQPPVNGFTPGTQPRTPQQILQEMQQRQLLIEQQQRNGNPPNQQN